jgi:hypothetical protein
MGFYHLNLLTSNTKLLHGNMQLIACAGSGKTEFVSERIARTGFDGFRDYEVPEFLLTFFQARRCKTLGFSLRKNEII